MKKIIVTGCHDCPYNKSMNDGSDYRICEYLDKLANYPDGEEPEALASIVISPQVLVDRAFKDDCPLDDD